METPRGRCESSAEERSQDAPALRSSSRRHRKSRCDSTSLCPDAPNGKPRFYREYTQSDYFHIHLTGGQGCLEFSFTGDVEPFARRLPPNVYCECERTSFTLNLKRFRQASAEIEEFFSFAVRLKKAFPYVARRTYENCFVEYFRDKNEIERQTKRQDQQKQEPYLA